MLLNMRIGVRWVIWLTPMRGMRAGGAMPRGFSGVLALNFVDYLAELPYFAQEVLPRLEQLGLRARLSPWRRRGAPDAMQGSLFSCHTAMRLVTSA
jgi:hypothetical protein